MAQNGFFQNCNQPLGFILVCNLLIRWFNCENHFGKWFFVRHFRLSTLVWDDTQFWLVVGCLVTIVTVQKSEGLNRLRLHGVDREPLPFTAPWVNRSEHAAVWSALLYSEVARQYRAASFGVRISAKWTSHCRVIDCFWVPIKCPVCPCAASHWPERGQPNRPWAKKCAWACCSEKWPNVQSVNMYWMEIFM